MTDDDERERYAPFFASDVLDSARVVDGRVPFWLRPDMCGVTLGARIHLGRMRSVRACAPPPTASAAARPSGRLSAFGAYRLELLALSSLSSRARRCCLASASVHFVAEADDTGRMWGMISIEIVLP